MSDICVASSLDDAKDNSYQISENLNDDSQSTASNSRLKKNSIKRIVPVEIKKKKDSQENVHNCDKKNGEHKEEDELLNKLVAVCIKYDNSKSMHNILNLKLRRYYNNCNSDYIASRQFKSLLTSQIDSIISNPKNLFIPLKEVVDELRARRVKTAEPPEKRQKLSNDDASTPNQNEGDTETQPKTSDRLLRKLCKTLELLHRKIKKLEEKDVDFEDDNDSTYMQLQRFKDRFCKVHQKLQELEGGGSEGSRKFRRRIVFSGTPFPSVNRAIEKFVNKKGEFPDFFDILNLLKETYESENIKIKPEKLRIQAKSAFQDIGEQLQRQRQYDCWDAHAVFLGAEQDPADLDEGLWAKLQENQEKYGNRISEVIEKFAEKESIENLKPEEVAEEDADKSEEDSSPKEGDEDDDAEDDDDDDKDFVDKVLKGDDDLKDLSSDGDDDGPRFDYCYGGPVSPPSLENRESEASIVANEETLKQKKMKISKQESLPVSSPTCAISNSKLNNISERDSVRERNQDNNSKEKTKEVPDDSEEIKQPQHTVPPSVIVKMPDMCSESQEKKSSSKVDSDKCPDETNESNEDEKENSIVRLSSSISDVSAKLSETKEANQDKCDNIIKSESNVEEEESSDSNILHSKTRKSSNSEKETDTQKPFTGVRVKSFGSFAQMESNLKKYVLNKSKQKTSKKKDDSDDDIIMLD